MKEKAPKRYEKWLTNHASSLRGRHVLITGGNSGIGFACAQHLLHLGVEFVDRYSAYRLERDKEFKKLYDKMNKYIEKRTKLNQRLLTTLRKRLILENK